MNKTLEQILHSGLKKCLITNKIVNKIRKYSVNCKKKNYQYNSISFCSTIVRSSWEYSAVDGVDFDKAWKAVRQCILNNFAGEPEAGVLSPSVQHTLYLTEKEVLDIIPQVIEKNKCN